MLRKILKQTFSIFKRSSLDFITMSLGFCFFLFIIILIGYSLFEVLGVGLAFLFLISPILVGYKYSIYTHIKNKNKNKNFLTVGLKTYTNSLKLYFSVVSRPLIWAFLALVLLSTLSTTIILFIYGGSNVYEEGFGIVNEILEENSEARTFVRAFEYVSLVLAYFIFAFLKRRRNFIAFMAFEMPLDVEVAEHLNKEILKNKQAKYMLGNIIISVLFIPPVAVATFVYYLLYYNFTFQTHIAVFISIGVFLFLSAFVISIIQIYNYVFYQNNKLKNRKYTNKELEQILKKITSDHDKKNSGGQNE